MPCSACCVELHDCAFLSFASQCSSPLKGNMKHPEDATQARPAPTQAVSCVFLGLLSSLTPKAKLEKSAKGSPPPDLHYWVTVMYRACWHGLNIVTLNSTRIMMFLCTRKLQQHVVLDNHMLLRTTATHVLRQPSGDLRSVLGMKTWAC